MALQQTPSREGVRKAPLIPVSITVAATNTVIYTVTTGRTFVIRKLWISNRQAAGVQIRIGDLGGAAAAFRDVLPTLRVPGSSDVQLPEEEIPCVEFEGGRDLVLRSSAAAVDPDDVLVSVEVEEFGG